MRKRRSRPDRVLFQTETPLQSITAAEDVDNQIRYMFTTVRDDKQGGIYLGDPEKLLFEYARTSFMALAFIGREPRRAMFVGLGAGSMPMYLSRYCPDCGVDVVELDPEVLRLARNFFYFEEEGRNMQVHISDGRDFLGTATDGVYDMIFLDAYRGGAIPYHMCTIEFLLTVRSKLAPNGVVVANLLDQEMNELFHDMIATYYRAFPNLYMFRGITSFNNVVIASTDERRMTFSEVQDQARRIQRQKKLDIKLPKLLAQKFTQPRRRRRARVLTD